MKNRKWLLPVTKSIEEVACVEWLWLQIQSYYSVAIEMEAKPSITFEMSDA